MKDSTHNHPELIELAVLDAYGLLDPIESELFNRSFHNAPASVQDEIIRLQHRFATDESLLPSDLPSSTLKKKVLHTVAKAADTEAKRLAPLALIGARAVAENTSTAASTSILLWRSAAIILFCVTVVLAIFTLDTQRAARDFSSQIVSLQARMSIEQNGKPSMLETL
ncbi:MAG: hypothetical protein VX436_01315, partial [Planctomycetota bacterium]|nr:hypothetical protein [Planctomycetota bacterium]